MEKSYIIEKLEFNQDSRYYCQEYNTGNILWKRTKSKADRFNHIEDAEEEIKKFLTDLPFDSTVYQIHTVYSN